MSSTIYTDPRLAALYDALNPAAADTDFYLSLLGAPARIADLGCGTGLLACTLDERGHRVTGIDPSAQMLRIARKRPHGNAVRWIEGDAGALAFAGPVDWVLMTGHVAQIFLDDATFLQTLRAARYALRHGGRVAFESRNPAARAWEGWTKAESIRCVEVEGAGRVEVWNELREAQPSGLVRFDTIYRFESTGEEQVAASELRFRSREELAGLLATAGFGVIDWYGDWDRTPVGAGSRELIAVAS
ncbi:ubiquinone/menaquinone biosynthesis methylase-like protein [Caballeronia terrestris]|uniref:Ubiquinone/menaquinone biosynthesis methylase-like protein n=1 Tax=Caballeronia terrestris TaxID=1226301 RepID=A0A158K188_9BURK|nr:class I SAM-dependent methyltransferase [Caballeronia terrestris]SAL74453.1 ubiquinone/menaquinone biosynthesis methylase-like protein [Caballeronia terrestris]